MAMDIERTESLTGAMKESIAIIMTDEQEYDAYDQYLGRKKPYMERISGGAKKGTTQKFAKEREEQQDDFKEEIKGYHDQAAASVISSEILNTGINPSEPAFVYKTRYTMDGWVKRAGSNLVVSAGKLIGTQSKVRSFGHRRGGHRQDALPDGQQLLQPDGPTRGQGRSHHPRHLHPPGQEDCGAIIHDKSLKQK